MSGYLLDTHYWLWFQMGNAQRLPPVARDQLIAWQSGRELYLSAISVWEVARLAADGHVDLGTSVDAFVAEATSDGGLQVVQIGTGILIESTRLPGDLHRDPADRLLAATVREHNLTLVTRDRELLRYGRRGHLRALAI